MYGDFETSDLKCILDVRPHSVSPWPVSDVSTQLWLDNREHLAGLNSIFSRAMTLVSSLFLRLFGQTLSNAKLNAVRFSPVFPF